MSRLGETAATVCHPQVDQFVDFFNIMMYECATSGESDGQLNAEIFWDPTNPDHGCQPGGAANEAVNIFLQEGVAPSQLNMGTPFYGYLYSDVSELFGECPPADQTKDGACKGISAHNYGTFFKQRINQKGWHTYYDPIALVPYMLRVDGTPGSSRTTTRFRLTPRVVLRLAVESGRSVHVVD